MPNDDRDIQATYLMAKQKDKEKDKAPAVYPDTSEIYVETA